MFQPHDAADLLIGDMLVIGSVCLWWRFYDLICEATEDQFPSLQHRVTITHHLSSQASDFSN